MKSELQSARLQGRIAKPLVGTQCDTSWYCGAMEHLVEVVQQLSLARDLTAVMEIVRHAARRLTGADGASFVLRDGNRCHYAEEDAIGPLWKGQRFPMSTCISGWTMLNKQPAVIENIYADSRIPVDAYRPTFVRSLVMVPIRTLDPIGAIGTYWARQHLPSEAQVKVLQALADTTAVAMENVRVYGELEQRVKERTAELATILDNVRVGVVFASHGRVVRANPRAAELFGYSDAGLLDLPIRQLLRAQDGAVPLAEEAQASFVEAKIFDVEARVVRCDTSNFWAHVIAKPLLVEAYPDSEIWMIDDITAAKDKETLLTELKLAAEETTRFKSEFLASMSHELRTPLNAIIGFSEILRDGIVGKLEARQHEYICDIFDSGQHLLALINDILDLSKVEAGKAVLEAEMTDVGQLLAGSLSVVREKSMTQRVALRLDVASDLGPCWVDPRKAKQIVYNLLSNAVKFTPEGGVVTVRAAVVGCEQPARQADAWPEVRTPLPKDADRFLEISVSDTGIGIAGEDMKRLFQPFVQIDSSYARRFQGTGLGLALVRKLVELHGGAVAVASMPAKGSRFTVWLPHRSGPEVIDDCALSATAAVAPARGVRSPSVMVVEDNDQAADLIRLQLEANGCGVARAATAEAAIAMLACEPLPDLISLDILLPDMNGWDLLARIKKDPHLARIPVVILSIVPEGTKGISLGAAQVLQKPTSMDELTTALTKLGFLQPHAAEKPATVLVIDDHSDAIEIVSSQLRSFQFNVLTATGGADGIRMAQSYAPDLIILDLLMPEVSGFEVVEALKKQWQTAGIPILVLTAKVISSEDRKALNGQVTQIMRKSEFNHGNFIAEVKRALACSHIGSPEHAQPI